MIQTHIFLEKTSNLYKNLKKRGFINRSGYIFIFLKYKPNIGELIEINRYSVSDEKFSNYLQNRKSDLVFRIIDLSQYHMLLKTDKEGIDVINLKCEVASEDFYE